MTLRVLIIQAQVKGYRVPFFTQLSGALQSSDIQLRVAYSSPNSAEFVKQDICDLPTGLGVKVPARWLFSDKIVYQALLRELAAADLVIIEQANKHIVNWVLVASSRLRLKRVAFWGHGRNYQANPSNWPERLKRRTITYVDWWFAYTSGVRDYLLELEFPADKITVVNNSIDTSEFSQSLAAVSNDELCALRKALRLTSDASVGLFCGGLYRSKNLDFLLEAAALIREAIPNFHMVIIGAGTDSNKVTTAAQKTQWIHYVGPKFGQQKASYFRLASLFLMPAAVGLSILDAFVAKLPFFTTDADGHGPEIQYIENSINGFITRQNSSTYANIVIKALQNPGFLRQLSEGAGRSADSYSIEKMVENVRTGIVRCLGLGDDA